MDALTLEVLAAEDPHGHIRVAQYHYEVAPPTSIHARCLSFIARTPWGEATLSVASKEDPPAPFGSICAYCGGSRWAPWTR